LTRAHEFLVHFGASRESQKSPESKHWCGFVLYQRITFWKTIAAEKFVLARAMLGPIRGLSRRLNPRTKLKIGA
jgi:hypothetical protein